MHDLSSSCISDTFFTNIAFPSEKGGKYFHVKVLSHEGVSILLKLLLFSFFSPTPQIEWKRINGDLVESRMIQYHQELLIRGIEYSDAGVYECRGKNAISSQAQTHRFTLQVECKY